MKASELVKEAIESNNMTISSASSVVGFSTRQGLFQMLRNDSMRADKFLEVMDQMNVDVVFVRRKSE